MRRGMAIAIAAAAVVAIATAGIAVAGQGATVVRAGSMVLEIDGGVSPRALPAYRFAPLEVQAEGRLTTVDGSHPPALTEAILDTDKDVAVDVRGLPTCRAGQLQAVETKRAKAACGDAIVGQGSATVEVAFPEQKPFDSTGPLLLFNGGERNGTITLLAFAYVSVPAPTAVVATAKIHRVNKGPYGLHTVVDVPRIAGGAGSVVAANIRMGRVYSFGGKKSSFLSGRCRDGRLQARGVFTYSDATVLSGSVVRTCTVAG